MTKKEFIGEKWEIPPERLFKKGIEDPVANFFLVLAVTYNDLKGIILFRRMLDETYRVPAPREVNLHAGEYSGITIQISKLLVGYLKEFFTFIEKNEQVINTDEFKEIVAHVDNQDVKNRWEEICNIALGKNVQKSDFSKKLVLIRNNISFHYFQSGKELKKAFCKYFFDIPEFEGNRVAYYSISETMEKSRFYYADAAVDEYLRSNPVDPNEVKSIIDSMNLIILRLLKSYLRNRPKVENISE